MAASSSTTASVLSEDECREIVKKHLQRDDFDIKSFEITSHGPETKGFMGDYLKLRITVSLRDQEGNDAETTEVQFFAKSVPREEGYRKDFVTSTVAYLKEVLFYGDLLEGVRRHLRCTEEESWTWLDTAPRCYHLRPDLLVLEDLSLAGFRSPEPLQPLSVAQCEGALGALARLHAASLALEERAGRRLADAYPLLLRDTVYQAERGSPMHEAQASCLRMIHVLLDIIPRFAFPGINEELHRLLDPTMEQIHQLLKPNDKYRLALCHRDMWANNILFKENAAGKLSVRLVDFQSIHLEPPAHDVMTFLHLGTRRVTRSTHGGRLLLLYHKALAEVLDQHGLDVDSILPLQVFLESCEERKKVAVALAACILQVTMLPLPQGADLQSFVSDHTELVRDAYKTNADFRTRVTEAIDDLVDTCLLPRLGK